jgi:outer membrane immunogenic protein
VLHFGDGFSGWIGYIRCRTWTAPPVIDRISIASGLNEAKKLETTMKKFLLGTVALVAFAAPAAAADLAARPYTKAPAPMIAAIYDWSGFYIGLNGGWGSSRNCWDDITPGGVFLAAEGCHDATGGVVGGQIGYRWQAGGWVFGLEAQGDWADLHGSNTSLAFPATNIRTRVDAFGLFTGQVGYAFNNALLYVKGGAAVTDSRYDITTVVGNALVANTGDQTRWGATVGAGLEYGFAPNWSAAIEYDHIFSQNQTFNFNTPAGAFFGPERIRQDVDLVTARVNYRWGGPVVAKY